MLVSLFKAQLILMCKLAVKYHLVLPGAQYLNVTKCQLFEQRKAQQVQIGAHLQVGCSHSAACREGDLQEQYTISQRFGGSNSSHADAPWGEVKNLVVSPS